MAKSKKRSRAESPEATPEAAALNELSRYERYEIVEVDRTELKNAPYNPRKIVPSAQRNLKRVVEQMGFVAPPVWNCRTGNIVGGHQRLTVLDSLQRSQKYRLHVARIDVDDKVEKEINLALNNPSIQGDWDMGKLEAMLPQVDLECAGFNLEDVYKVFGYEPMIEDAGKLSDVADKLRGIRERREKHQAKHAERSDLRYYRVLVFESSAEARAWNESQGLRPDDEFLKGQDYSLVRVGDGEAQELHT